MSPPARAAVPSDNMSHVKEGQVPGTDKSATNSDNWRLAVVRAGEISSPNRTAPAAENAFWRGFESGRRTNCALIWL